MAATVAAAAVTTAAVTTRRRGSDLDLDRTLDRKRNPLGQHESEPGRSVSFRWPHRGHTTAASPIAQGCAPELAAGLVEDPARERDAATVAVERHATTRGTGEPRVDLDTT